MALVAYKPLFKIICRDHKLLIIKLHIYWGPQVFKKRCLHNCTAFLMFVSLFNLGKLSNLNLISQGPALMPSTTGALCYHVESFAEACLSFISIVWRMIVFQFEGRRFSEKPVL